MDPSVFFNHLAAAWAVRLLLVLAIAIGGLSLVWRAQATDSGSYWSLQNTNYPPLPYNPFPAFPVYSLGNGSFQYDDRSVDYLAIREEIARERAWSRFVLRQGQYSILSSESDPPEPPEPGEDDPPGDDPTSGSWNYSTNVLWIELYAYDPANALAYLTLHNTRSNFYYQLLSRSDVTAPPWRFGEIVQNSVGTNQVFFQPVTSAVEPNQFFRGVEGATVVSIFGPTNAMEPNSAANDPGKIGQFKVDLSDSVDFDLTVVYRISGSASNGVDYAALTGSLTIPSNTSFGVILISATDDDYVEFDETVTISLVLTNGYLVAPDHASAIVALLDNFTNQVFKTVTSLPGPIGIDYHAPSNSLIVSYNYDGNGVGYNFARIYTNIVVSTNVLLTNWSGIAGLLDEVKLAAVKANLGGFTNGDVFFSSSTGVGWLSADSSVSNLNWCILTNSIETNALPLRGGLYVDQTGVFSNQLIAVTSPHRELPVTKECGGWTLCEILR